MLRIAPLAEDVVDSIPLAQQVLRAEAAALTNVADRLGDSFNGAVDRLLECAGSIIVTGMGKAGLIGKKAAATLASTGAPAHFLHPAEAGHGDLGRVADRDCVLALSHSGETAELIQLLDPLTARGVPIVGVTSYAHSQLARRSRPAIVYGPVEEACPLGLAPSTSCAVMLAIGDALAFALMTRRGFQKDDFGRRHPAGSLGRKFLIVDQVMRPTASLRVTSAELPVREVFTRVARQGRRSGAILLIDEAGKLTGLFTDSDLARLVERRELNAFDRPIREVMTTRPLTLQSGQRILDALEMLRRHQISEIPVLNDRSEPVGLIDITDLISFIPEAA